MVNNIVIVISNLEMGGAQRVSLTLSEWMLDHGLGVTIVSFTETTRPSYDIASNVVILSGVNKFLNFRRLIDKIRPDIVLVMGVPLGMYVIPLILGLKTKIIVSERNDPSHFKGKEITKFLSRFMIKYADGYVFQTEDARLFYNNIINNNKISDVIPNPLFIDLSSNENAHLMTERNKIIVNVGRLHVQKNQKLLIRAFKQVHDNYPDFKLYIYGEGNLRTELESLVSKLSLEDSVFLPGNVKDIVNIMKGSYMFVLSSDFEGMPNALLEAMALGIPCISTDCPCGGPREIISEGKNGLLVPVNDELAMVKAMIRLIQDEALANRLSTEALKVREKYSKETVCSKWYDFFNKFV